MFDLDPDKARSKFKIFTDEEKRLGLDSHSYFGVCWWDLLRYESYIKFLGENVPHKSTKGFRDRIKKCKNILYYAVDWGLGFIQFLWLFIRQKKSSVMIVTHPRKVLSKGRLIDIYTERVFSDLAKVESVIRVEPRPFVDGFIRNENVLSIGIFNFLAGSFSRIFIKTNFIDRYVDNCEVTLVINEFNDKVGADILSLKKIQYYIVRFLILKKFYKLLLSVIRPNHVLLVVSCGNEAVVAAAREKGIPVSELQHGSPVKGKLNYDYSNGITKTLFPDYFLAFSQFFCSSNIFPISSENCIPIGFPYLTDEKYQCANIKENIDCLFITQPIVDKYFFNFILDFKLKYPNKTVGVRLHPSTTRTSIDEYRSIRSIEIIEKNTETIYESISRSSIVVGSYSTALFEAVSFNKPVFSFSCGEYALPDDVCSYSGILKINNVDDIFNSKNVKINDVGIIDDYDFCVLYQHIINNSLR
jgi:hypothetical protein